MSGDEVKAATPEARERHQVLSEEVEEARFLSLIHI